MAITPAADSFENYEYCKIIALFALDSKSNYSRETSLAEEEVTRIKLRVAPCWLPCPHLRALRG